MLGLRVAVDHVPDAPQGTEAGTEAAPRGPGFLPRLNL
jgi:hypothetical protein